MPSILYTYGGGYKKLQTEFQSQISELSCTVSFEIQPIGIPLRNTYVVYVQWKITPAGNQHNPANDVVCQKVFHIVTLIAYYTVTHNWVIKVKAQLPGLPCNKQTKTNDKF